MSIITSIPTSVHLGFDMGIRNLAYCLMSHTSAGGEWTIEAWDNVDLLSGGVSAQDARRCIACSSPAAWEDCSKKELWCKACATGVRRKKTATRIPTLPALPCGLTVKDLRPLGIEKGWADKKTKKEDLLQKAATHYLMPWRAPKATHPSLAHIRRQMDAWLDRMLPTFAKATLIRLENQPVMKGPTMKSIQMMLFTLLGHRLEREHAWRGEIVFVHAGVKTRSALDAEEEPAIEVEATDADAEAGKAYRARKKTAEVETLAALVARGPTAATWKAWFEGRSKKSDLADAFLMALRPS